MLCLSQLCALTPELKCLLQTNPLFKLGSISSLLIAPKVFFFQFVWEPTDNYQILSASYSTLLLLLRLFLMKMTLLLRFFFFYGSLLFLVDIFLPKNKDLWLYFYIGFWRTIYLIPQTYVRKSNFSRQIFTFDK